jgi:hypothetical protein
MAMSEVDLSQYKEKERKIIALIEVNGHPMTEWWVEHYLSQARSVLGPALIG